MAKPVVLFLCTGNSCRSQMAEVLLKDLAGDRFSVYSAGTDPAEAVHPLTLQVLEEAGYDVANLHPKSSREFLGHLPVYYLWIVCDHAAQVCPTVWPGVFERYVEPFPDPAAVEGDDKTRLQAFRATRDRIRARLEEWLADLEAQG